MHSFDYRPLAAELHLTREQLQSLELSVKHDYPKDEMMQELRMLRTLRAIRDGRQTLEGVLMEAGRLS